MIANKSTTVLKPAAMMFGALLISAAVAQSVPAQKSQRREGQRPAEERSQQRAEQQQRRQQSQMDKFERSDVMDELAEGVIVIKLAARPGLDDVNVEVNDGVAVLSGKVASQQAERRALRTADSTMGVRSVRDQLSVDSSLANRREPNVSDKDLAKQVAQKIAANIEGAKAGEDWWFDGWRVEGPFNRWNLVVDVSEPGRVILDGDVPSIHVMRKAVETAAKVPGVRTVDSDLRIDPYYYGYEPYYRYSPYYGYGYRYHPDVLPPHAWDPDNTTERLAGSRQEQSENRPREQ